MALRSKREELDAAWRALAGYQSAEGWCTIPVATGGPCHLLAGRHFPGNEEALLVGFASIRIPSAEQLPQGSGFFVSRADIGGDGAGYIWIALYRQSTGNPEFFGMMADDVVITLERQRVTDDDRLFHVFISRIRAWQEFMRRGDDGFLSPEAEVGLFGELSFMQELIYAGLPAAVAIDAWQGPLDGSQDFSLGIGAIEVKSTVSLQGFPAKIGTLDQLDDSLIRPLFLAAVRLAINPSGKTLPTIIRETRNHLTTEPAALADLDTRLLHAGYLDAAVARHTRCFLRTGLRLLPITDNFPRLTRANVAIEIRKARYELDLDLIPSGDVALIDALKQLGVI
jgi:hypothetical protein